MGGFAFGGIGQTYGVVCCLLSWTSLAACKVSGELIKCVAVAAITLAAWTMPLCATGVLPCATVCHVWNGVPTAQVATRAWTVGVTQLTSPTSVDPSPPWLGLSSGATKSHNGSSGGVCLPAACSPAHVADTGPREKGSGIETRDHFSANIEGQTPQTSVCRLSIWSVDDRLTSKSPRQLNRAQRDDQLMTINNQCSKPSPATIAQVDLLPCVTIRRLLVGHVARVSGSQEVTGGQRGHEGGAPHTARSGFIEAIPVLSKMWLSATVAVWLKKVQKWKSKNGTFNTLIINNIKQSLQRIYDPLFATKEHQE